jgi:EmrB/QacA subfamily drug resistance transporter
VILCGTFMVTLDFFIVNVAIPSIQSELHASDAAIEWVVAGYGLAYAALLIIGGRLGDLHGRRRMFCAGMAAFTGASVACGLAPSAAALVLGRLVQGAGAAVLAPQVLAILGTTYTGTDRGRAFAVYGVVLGLASAMGQVIGGLLIHSNMFHLGWRTCFLVNLPVGLAALLLAPRLVRDSRGDARGADPVGAVLVTLGLTAVLLPLIQGRANGWPLWTWCSFAVAALVLGWFGGQQRVRCRSGRSVLIDPTLWRASRFHLGLLAVLLLYSGVASFFFVLALYLQVGRGLDAQASGVVASTMAVGFCITSLAASRIRRRMGRPTLMLGALGMAVGLGALRVTVGLIGADGSVALLVPPLFVDGLGMGLVMAPLISTVLAGLPAADAGSAAGVLASINQFGNALGVAMIGIVYFGLSAHGGSADAFSGALDCLIALALMLAAIVQRLR